ncbi:MAG TPA: glutaredoxin-like protein NrdH [Candidatus Ligilactobacillus excrementigallinarum]|uniref:Glutaredoxin-like protein NrdH n=1 Tax=Candidatus Ligilactobacillus excrementigallinarum TaxID=2838641 RepID=A0A9D2A959_9LACO|nr:glutaredoxin-like protein NrdH [Candidatus Ligilactobacillus excrementigallinarum]
MNLVLFTKNNCIQCKMTKRFLEENQISFTEHNISQEPEYINYLKEKGFQSVPVLERNAEPIINGFRPDQLKQLLATH